MIFIRKCPNCGEDISYSTKWNRDRAEKQNTNCNSCSKKGRKITWGDKISESLTGIKQSEETKKRMSESKKGIKRKPFTDETKVKMRLSRLKYLKQLNGQISPNYNSVACDIIRWFNMYHNFNFRHAENGGEVCIGGYWPDGLDEKRKTIIEIDEPQHYDKNENLKQKDVQRQKYLEGLGYKFIRVRIQ